MQLAHTFTIVFTCRPLVANEGRGLHPFYIFFLSFWFWSCLSTLSPYPYFSGSLAICSPPPHHSPFPSFSCICQLSPLLYFLTCSLLHESVPHPFLFHLAFVMGHPFLTILSVLVIPFWSYPASHISYPPPFFLLRSISLVLVTPSNLHLSLSLVIFPSDLIFLSLLY